MKKTFPLQAHGKDDARVRDKIRHEVNKYVRRERQKALPEGYTWWAFACRVGPDAVQAATKNLEEVGGAIDAVAQTGATAVYVEIVASPSQRPPSRRSPPASGD
jgi:acetylornithine deacetylase/succinyl-diaminopimelate desuccinylase-like protein